jgi:WD40 repeat protein
LVQSPFGPSNFGDVDALVIIISNEYILSGSEDKTIKVWDSKSFHLITTLIGHTKSVNTLVIIASNKNIVSGSDYVDQTIRV